MTQSADETLTTARTGEALLIRFSGLFGIELLSYSILSNHYHLLLRTRPDIVARWSDTEVARRWLMICPKRKINGLAAEPTEAEIDAIRNCPAKLGETRRRLSDVSWWIRLLNQRVAQRANRDDEQSGRFWQDRFRAIRVDDDASLLACSAYVDLNPIRAGLAKTIEDSQYTSVQKRIQAEVDAENRTTTTNDAKATSSRRRRDAFLAKLSIDEKNESIGSNQSLTKDRCSDKGLFALTATKYFELLDWTARQFSPGKSGRTAHDAPPVLARIGLGVDAWNKLVFGFEEVFGHVAARVDRIEACRSYLTARRFRITPLARQLLPSATSLTGVTVADR